MNWLTFHLERVLLRGSHYRLLFMAAGVVAVAVGGGLSLFALGGAESVPDAVWWAFLRLTDPGYLGDDEGIGRRSLATVITVLGYVLWLLETVERLQRGETPIVARDHVLVLGLTEGNWTTGRLEAPDFLSCVFEHLRPRRYRAWSSAS